MTTHDHTTHGPSLTLVDNPGTADAALAARLSTVQRRLPTARHSAQLAAEPQVLGTRQATVIDLPVASPSTRRRWRFPILAAVLLSVAAQGALAAAIAAERVPAAVGALAAIDLAVCGLLLIAAQAVSVVTRQRAVSRP